MVILGEYSYSNFSIINTFDAHNRGIESTHLHEMIHLALTKSTEYGFFATIINRVVRFDTSYEYLNKILAKHMLRLQEGVSTFCEIVYHAQKTSLKDALDDLKELRHLNRQYYNYVHPHISRLLFFADSSNKEKYYFTPLELFDIVYKLAFVSMNCSLVTIPIEVMGNKRRLKPYIEQKNPQLYLPNSRFLALIKKLNNLLIAAPEKSIGKEDILKKTLEGIDVNGHYLAIISDSKAKDLYIKTYVDATKKYIRELFSKSNQKDLIYDTVNMFVAKYVDIQKLHHYVIPSSFKAMYNGRKVGNNEIMQLTNNDRGIFFIGIDGTYKETVNTASAYISQRVFEEIKKLYPAHILLTYMSLVKKKSFVSMFPIEDLNTIFFQDKIPVVVNYKLIEFVSQLQTDAGKKFFIYCDRPYSTAVEIINNYALTQKPTRFLEYKNMNIVVIRINNDVDLFLPIISILLPDVIRDINSKILNLTIDDDLEISFDNYDTIVNTLFSL